MKDDWVVGFDKPNNCWTVRHHTLDMSAGVTFNSKTKAEYRADYLNYGANTKKEPFITPLVISCIVITMICGITIAVLLSV